MTATLLVAAGSYLALCLLVFLLQGRMLYYPGPPPATTPADYGLAHRDASCVTADGVRIHAWYLPADQPRGAVVFCHGNAGNVEVRLPAARVLVEMGLSVLLFDYRGYGASEGSPTEEGTYLDAVAAYDWLVDRGGVPPERIAAYGESLGGAVAIELACRRPLAAVVTEAAFTSLPDVAARAYRWLPARLLCRFRYDSEAKVRELATPLLVVHSPGDRLVPYSHAERLVAAARNATGPLATAGGHEDGGFLQRGEWVAEMRAFLLGALP